MSVLLYICIKGQPFWSELLITVCILSAQARQNVPVSACGANMGFIRSTELTRRNFHVFRAQIGGLSSECITVVLSNLCINRHGVLWWLLTTNFLDAIFDSFSAGWVFILCARNGA